LLSFFFFFFSSRRRHTRFDCDWSSDVCSSDLHHLGDALDLAALAEHARMSVRTFSRRFRAETGMSPGTWLTRQRVEHARHLLETTDLSVDVVAERAGLGTGASLRQHMRASIGVPPLAYRK